MSLLFIFSRGKMITHTLILGKCQMFLSQYQRQMNLSPESNPITTSHVELKNNHALSRQQVCNCQQILQVTLLTITNCPSTLRECQGPACGLYTMQIKIQYTLYSTKDNSISLCILYTIGIIEIVIKHSIEYI